MISRKLLGVALLVGGGILLQPATAEARPHPSGNEKFHAFVTAQHTSHLSPNLGFGHGIHFCIGAPLARITAQAAFAALVRLDIAPAFDEVRYAPGLVVRGPAALPVHLRGSGGG